MSDVVIRVRDLSKSFGSRIAVDRVGFDVVSGEAYGFLGPNGAGKTTTISIICGLRDPDAGEVMVGGQVMSRRSLNPRAILGYVPQEVALYLDLTGRENLHVFARLYGLRGRELRARVDQVLDMVGLADRADERVRDYSGGMRRRLNLATSLVHRPQALVLDEPTVGVDPQSRNAILEMLEGLKSEGVAILFASHYINEVQRVCDQIGILDEGRLVAEGTPEELKAQVGGETEIRLSTSGSLDQLLASCQAVEGLESAALSGESVRVLARSTDIVASLVIATQSARLPITRVEVLEPDLEAVFLKLTGRSLRD
jgi:ABC-2 type transport system ATP-binding protein